jgi:transcriptional regulator with XRE-family HTH domain
MIGERLRSARRSRNLTLREVARRAEVSEGHLSKIETGRIAAGLPLLRRIAAGLGVNLAWLFDGGADRGPVARAGARPVLDLDPLRGGRGLRLERLIPWSRDAALQANIHIIEPGGGGDEPISHEGEEIGFVLEGRLELRIDDETHELGPGDSFHFRSHRPHSYRNKGAGVARILWVNTPPTF